MLSDRSSNTHSPRPASSGHPVKVSRPSAWRLTGSALLVVGALSAAAPAAAQERGSAEIMYRREVFQYQRTVRPDPFRTLLGSVDLSVRFENLVLRGIVYNSDPRESVAILVDSGSNRRVRARVGERIGAITVLAIHPRRVDLVIEDFGVPRRESLYLKVETETETQS
jgi:hypothetical protein